MNIAKLYIYIQIVHYINQDLFRGTEALADISAEGNLI